MGVNISDNEETAQLLASAFEALPFISLVVDHNGRILGANNLACQSLLTAHGLHTGTKEIRLSDVFEGDDATILLDVKAAASGSVLVLRPRLALPSGEDTLAFKAKAVKRSDHDANFFLLTESTERPFMREMANLNIKLEETNTALSKARDDREQVEDRYKSLESFMGMAAHDLRSPMRHITLYLDMFLEVHSRNVDEDGKDMLRTIMRATKRLSNLLDDLLDFARSGAKELQLETLAIDDILSGVHELHGVSIKQTGATISKQGDLGALDGDKVLVQQLFENIITNAIKYAHPERSPAIVISRRQNEPGLSEFVIEDNGQGFDPSHSEMIFKPFTRLLSDKTKVGSGIGLATVHSICTRHGWSVRAESEPDRGSRFIVTVPE